LEGKDGRYEDVIEDTLQAGTYNIQLQGEITRKETQHLRGGGLRARSERGGACARGFLHDHHGATHATTGATRATAGATRATPGATYATAGVTQRDGCRTPKQVTPRGSFIESGAEADQRHEHSEDAAAPS